MKLTMLKSILIITSLQLFLFIGLVRVNALSIFSGSLTNNVTGYDRAYNGFFIKDGNTLNSDWTVNYTISNVSISNYDYFITHLFFNYSDLTDYAGSTTEYQPVENTQYYCSSWSQRQQTYADGTQSTYYVCEIWSPSGQSSYYSNNEVGTTLLNQKVQIQIDLLQDDSYWSVCTIQNDSNGVSTVTCPLNHNRSNITRLRIRYTSLQWSEGNRSCSVGIANLYNLYRDPVRDLIIQNNSNTQSIINNNNTNAQAIQDGINNADYTGSTEQPDSTEFNNYHSEEQDLKGIVSNNTDLSVLDIGIDTDTSTWLWDTLTRLIQANSAVFSMFISILSIGILKLALGR